MTRPTTAQLNAAYDQFNFWYDKAKTLDEKLAKAEERIAELESRSVTVKLPKEHSATEFLFPVPVYSARELTAALTAQGIKWEVE